MKEGIKYYSSNIVRKSEIEEIKDKQKALEKIGEEQVKTLQDTMAMFIVKNA